MRLPLKIRKWIGSWWGDYCEVCGEPLVVDHKACELGYGLRTWCSTKKCKKFNKVMTYKNA